MIGIVNALTVQLVVEIPFQVFDIAGNERFVTAVRHRHSGMELFEVFRQTVGRQIFQHLGVELQHIPSRRDAWRPRSEEHTSELQSQSNLVCRLLLEKKKKK